MVQMASLKNARLLDTCFRGYDDWSIGCVFAELQISQLLAGHGETMIAGHEHQR